MDHRSKTHEEGGMNGLNIARIELGCRSNKEEKEEEAEDDGEWVVEWVLLTD